MHERWLWAARGGVAAMAVIAMMAGGCRKSESESASGTGTGTRQGTTQIPDNAVGHDVALRAAAERANALIEEVERERQRRTEQEARVAVLTAEAERTTTLLTEAKARQGRYGWIAVGAVVGCVVLFVLGAALGMATSAATAVPGTSPHSASHAAWRPARWRVPKGLPGDRHVEP